MSNPTFRRCSVCNVVSYGLLPARCTFAICQAPLVREARPLNLAPTDTSGSISPTPLDLLSLPN